jgi:DNA uptake protein ComE-like DNA-binding protein
MNRSFKRIWKAYNEYSKNDRNAILILSILILISLTAIIIVKNIHIQSKYDYVEFEELISEWENQKSENDGKILFSFNPNTITSEELDSLDLPENIKRNILNYRKAGGKFFKPEQMRKIYGMNDSIFNVIKNYIVFSTEPENLHLNRNNTLKQIPDFSDQYEKEGKTETEVRRQPSGFTQTVFTRIELNNADSADLVKLNGIGPVFAKRILKYRDLLGGFYSVHQLLEVYNFPVETFKNIENNISADTLLIKKIRLNFAEFPDLIRHPYLNKTQVETLLNFRGKNGAFHDLEQVKSNGLVDNDTFLKIRPYLTCR